MKNDALEALFRATLGEENVIEHMEAEGQRKAVRNCYVAKRMDPKMEEWEKLGFSFTQIPGDDMLCEAVLPEGWELKPTDHSMWTDIVDNNGHKRGSMFYKAAFYDRDAHMYLSPRYGVRTTYLNDEENTTEIYFGSDDEILYIAGRVSFPKDLSRKERLERYDLQDEFREDALKFGEENYPDFRDVHAYWDKPLELKQKKN